MAKDKPDTLIRVSVDSGSCCLSARVDQAAGIHDISIRKRRKRFIVIPFFFPFASPFFFGAASRRV